MNKQLRRQFLKQLDFNNQEKVSLDDYFSCLSRKIQSIDEQVRSNIASTDKRWESIIRRTSASDSNRLLSNLFEVQGAAIHQNKWNRYVNEVLTHAEVLCELDVTITDWLRLKNMCRREFIALAKSTIKENDKLLLSTIQGIELILDKSMAIISLFFVSRSDEVISDLNNELEAKVIERTNELNEINQELESFSYTISHDLRAPLRAIAGFASVLENNHSAQLDDTGKKYLSIIIKSATNMGVLIDDLLALSRIGRQGVRQVSFSLKDLFNEVYADLRLGDEGNDIQFKLNQLPEVKADRDLMKHVVKNLLENAIKYSAVRDSPKIEVGSRKIDGNIVFHVKDNGVGFDMKYEHKLFGIFERLHSSEEFEGTGVGLAIVERIIDKHNGRIWAESELNNGATFYFTLNQ